MRPQRYCIHLQSAVIVILIGVSARVSGYGFHDALGDGNSIECVDPRSGALVGSKVFGTEGPSALFLNPAALSGIEGFMTSVSGSAVTWGEVIVDSTSRTKRAGTGFNALTGALALRVSPSLVVAGGVARITDNQYDGTHYLPNDPTEPDIDRVEILQASGGLWEALGGTSVQITDHLSAGLSAGLRFGSADFVYVYDQYFTPGIDSTAEWTWDEEGICYHAGLTLKDGVLGIGAVYTSGSDHYPDRIAAGATALAEHLGHSTIGFEVEVLSPFMDNHFRGKLSVATPLRPEINLLTGVGFYDGENMYRTGMAYSLGGNYRIGRLMFETAVFFSGRSRNSTSFPSEYSDSVEDNWTVFCIGMDYGI
jgi:hypothetical protein